MKIMKWNGVPADPAEVERWRNEALEFLKEDSNEPYWHRVCGGTMVIGIRYQKRGAPTGAIYIWHTKIVDAATLVPTTQVVWEDADYFYH
jgi:hypothetical protein